MLPACPDGNEKPRHVVSEALSLPLHTTAFLLASDGTAARRVTRRRNKEPRVVA